MDHADAGTIPGNEEIEREGLRILRRLSEAGTVLAVARDMEMGVVVRDGGDGAPPQRVAVVARTIAEAMALKEWIGCDTPDARVARYRITGAGRGALKLLMAAAENRAQGFGEAQIPYAIGHDEPALRHMRTALAESPLAGLARRNDKDGQPFLSRGLVAVAERLREDFELASIGPQAAAEWERFLDAAMGEGVIQVAAPLAPPGARAAHDRVQAALADLGPGLRMWRCGVAAFSRGSSRSRSGWLVGAVGQDRAAHCLQRLQQHYLRTQGKFGPMIADPRRAGAQGQAVRARIFFRPAVTLSSSSSAVLRMSSSLSLNSSTLTTFSSCPASVSWGCAC